MSDNRAPFKRPSKKHEPKGLTILHEDHDIIVVNKAPGLLSVSTDTEKEKTAYFLLTNYVKKGNARSKARIFIVHRLDRDTSGVLVFAKNEKAKQFLQKNWHDFNKTYFAVVHGGFTEKEGIIESYLQENDSHRVYSVKDPAAGRLSKTGYKVVRASSKYSLLEVQLHTGRKHQIRVHFSEKGHPVVGDKMYGRMDKGIKRLALHAASLSIVHPFTKEKMSFETRSPVFFKNFVKDRA